MCEFNEDSYWMICRYEDVPEQYRHEVKEIAYSLDPKCWESYSGKTKQEKRAIDRHRRQSLLLATKQWREKFY